MPDDAQLVEIKWFKFWRVNATFQKPEEFQPLYLLVSLDRPKYGQLKPDLHFRVDIACLPLMLRPELETLRDQSF